MANISTRVSGMTTPSEGRREPLGVTESLWPSEPITLGLETSARQLVLKKIQDLSILVRREGKSRPFC